MKRSPLLSLIAVTLLLTTAAGQVPIAGALSDGAGGPLLTGTVYHASSISVPSGQTLTIQPGVIIKMNVDTTFTVNGNLVVNGTAGMPVIVTSLLDDTAGGDTNGDGASVGTPDWWRTLLFATGSTGTVTGLDLRFAGRFSNGGIELGDAGVSLTGCTVSNCSRAGLDANNVTSGTFLVDGCQFNDNDRAVEGVALASLPGFTNNTASGNATHDTIALGTNTTLTGGTFAVTAANMMSNVVISPSINVGAGATLSLDQGVIIKFAVDSTFNVDGTLLCTGTAGSPVVLTSLPDDAHGGDTNKDGATTVPMPDWWRTLVFDATASASMLVETEVWYAGRFNNAGIEIDGASLTLDSCRVRSCSQAAIDMDNQEAALTVTGCDFQGCNRAVEGVPMESVSGFTHNTASNNTLHDSLAVQTATITGHTTVTKDNMISNVIISPLITIDAGASLTFDEGCIIKFTVDRSVTVDGDLFCNGTSAEPVIFTAITDDASGGDTNNDGAATVPTPDFWRSLRFNSTSTSQLTHTDVLYGGRFNNAGFEIVGAAVNLQSCSARFCSQAGLDANNVTAAYTVQDCAFMNNGRAVEGVTLESVPNFLDCTASGNTTHDTIDVQTASIASGTTTITTQNLLSNVIYCPNITVAAGAKLSLGSGVIIKVKLDATVSIDGELECLGSAGSEVVFTDFQDDDHGGDSNNDGPSAGGADWWRTLRFNPGSAASHLEHVLVRYAGRFNNAGIIVLDDVTLLSCSVDSCTREGFDLQASAARPLVEECDVTNCGEAAYFGLTWSSLGNFFRNTASGNGGNYAHVTSSTVGLDDRVFADAVPSGVIVMSANPNFEAGDSLILEAGVIVKVSLDRSFNVTNGTFEARGTAFEPVVFTDFSDDDFGGDTNNDGPSSGAVDWWRGVDVDAGATTARLDHVIIRFAGRFSNPGLDVDNPAAEITSLRVDSCSREGAEVARMAGDIANWLIHDCGEVGIRLAATAPSVNHCTVADCILAGIDASASWTGTVTNTISWNNTGGNYIGISDSAILSSNGSPTAAGMNGNTNVDPMFAGAATGDYSLMAGSPCLDVADTGAADALQEDHLEASRRTDDDLSGILAADMGAFEKLTFNLDVQGAPRIGGVQTYSFTGSMNAVGALLVTPLNEVNTFFPNYGWLLVSPPGQVSLISSMAPGIPLLATIPDFPVLIGYRFQAQAIVLDLSNPMRGNFTQRYRTIIRP